jgi:hypothetical protein
MPTMYLVELELPQYRDGFEVEPELFRVQTTLSADTLRGFVLMAALSEQDPQPVLGQAMSALERGEPGPVTINFRTGLTIWWEKE